MNRSKFLCRAAHNALGDCAYDGVKVFRGDRAGSNPEETFCGNEIPHPISIVGSTLLNFYTDSHTVGIGFLATYAAIRE